MTLASLVLATGCDIVFPLRAPDASSDGDPDAALGVDAFEFRDAPAFNPNAPSIAVFSETPDPAFVGEPASVMVRVTGTQNRDVQIDLDSGGAGAFAQSSLVLNLGGGGDATTPVVSYTTPSRFQNVILTASAAYTADLSMKNSSPIQLPVDQRFGHPEITGATTADLSDDDIVTFLVNLGPGPSGNVVVFGFTGSGGRARVALYAPGFQGKPGTLIAQSPAFQLPPTLARVEIPVPMPPQITGKVWVAIQIETDTKIQVVGVDDSPPAIRSSSKFSAGFPPDFPMNTSTVTDHHQWAMYINVAP